MLVPRRLLCAGNHPTRLPGSPRPQAAGDAAQATLRTPSPAGGGSLPHREAPAAGGQAFPGPREGPGLPAIPVGARRLLAKPFSDLILCRHGPFFAKGIPGTGPGLLDLSCLGSEVVEELALMAQELDERGVGRQKAAERYTRHGVRYRVSAEEDIRAGSTWFLRRMPESVPALESLDLRPSFVRDWLMGSDMGSGLCLFAGAQASGKTTLASAATAWRLARFGGHCVTFEAPAEMPLAGPHGPRGYCWQTEIAGEEDLPRHLVRAHMFASPDIIYVGEIKTATAAVEALRMALGSPRQVLVATIHGTDVVSALRRLLDWAVHGEGASAAGDLAMTLSTILLLDLKADGSGRRWLEVPQCLLVPRQGCPLAPAIRAQLAGGDLAGLAETMARQRARLERAGLQGLR